ncbi:MAG: hypothetical protein ACM319_09940, partial [Deltaproteobacteria bacterium]
DSVQGCDAAAGVGACSLQGLAGTGTHIFQIADDVDFHLAALNSPPGGATAAGSPCRHINAEPRFGANGLCGAIPTLAEEMAVLMPIPRAIQARTGQKLPQPMLRAVDVSGNEATWGQYLFPFGINLGGISLQAFAEIDLNLVNTPNLFEGIPWNLDRRISPGGCLAAGCETTPQPLDPFPASGLDPRTAFRDLILARNPASIGDVPRTPYANANYSASGYDNVIHRIFGYVDPNQQRRPGAANLTTSGEFPADALPDVDVLSGNFNGTSAIAPFPPVNPAGQAITAVAPVVLVCAQANSPVTGVALAASPPSPQGSGSAVAFTASAKGTSGAYEYQFLGRRAGSPGPLSIARSYSPSATWNWSAAGVPGGTYEIQVQARNAGSAAPFEATQTLNYTVTTPAATDVTLAPAPAGPQTPGTLVTFNAAVSGGGAYEYEFLGRPVGGTIAVAQAYSTLASWIWNTSGAPPGNWEITVLARSAGSSAAFEAIRSILYGITGGTVTATLSASPASPQPAGTPVAFTASAGGGTGPYEYQFLGRRVGDPAFGIAQAYGPSNSWTWAAAAGNWEVQVMARNVGSAAPFDAVATVTYTVN